MRKYLLILVFALSSVSCSGGNTYRICLPNNHFIVYVTPTIKTVSILDETYGPDGYIRLLRGDIKVYQVVDNYLVGYLSLEHTAADDLGDFLGKNDKEGYFVIDLSSNLVNSGLSFLDASKEASDLNFRFPQDFREVNIKDACSW